MCFIKTVSTLCWYFVWIPLVSLSLKQHVYILYIFYFMPSTLCARTSTIVGVENKMSEATASPPTEKVTKPPAFMFVFRLCVLFATSLHMDFYDNVLKRTSSASSLSLKWQCKSCRMVYWLHCPNWLHWLHLWKCGYSVLISCCFSVHFIFRPNELPCKCIVSIIYRFLYSTGDHR